MIRAVAVAVAVPAFACTSSPGPGAGDIERLLPSERQLESWKSSEKPLRYQAANLSDFIDGGAETYLDYGLVQAITQQYQQRDDSLTCTIYEMKDPEAAFGIFSYVRSPQKSPVSLGDGGFRSDVQLAFWQRQYFVVLEAFSLNPTTERALDGFARRISEDIGGRAGSPAILGRLPPQRLIQGTEKLLKGRPAADALSAVAASEEYELDKDDRLLYGEYESPRGRAKLFLVVYQQPEKVKAARARWTRLLSSDKSYRSIAGENAGSLWQKEGRFFLIREAGDSLALIAEASSADEAREMSRTIWSGR